MADTDRGFEELVAQEKLIADTTGLIYTLMDQEGVSKAELARRVGRSRGYITQILDGRRNMTLRTLAQLGMALGRELEVVPANPKRWAREREHAMPYHAARGWVRFTEPFDFLSDVIFAGGTVPAQETRFARPLPPEAPMSLVDWRRAHRRKSA